MNAFRFRLTGLARVRLILFTIEAIQATKTSAVFMKKVGVSRTLPSQWCSLSNA